MLKRFIFIFIFCFLILWSSFVYCKEKESDFLPTSFFLLPVFFLQDEKIMEEISSLTEDNFSKEGAKIFNIFGDGGLQIGALAILYMHSSNTYHKKSACLAFNSWIKAASYTWILKVLTGRARPGEEKRGFFGPTLRYNSFPSGHTSTAFAIATVLGKRYKAEKIAYILATFVGVSRIILRKHYPSDVLAGAIIGYLAGKQTLDNDRQSFSVSLIPNGWKFSLKIRW